MPFGCISQEKRRRTPDCRLENWMPIPEFFSSHAFIAIFSHLTSV
jgi:hypothetical protein